MWLALLGLDVPGGVVLKVGLPFSEGKRRGQCGKGFVRLDWDERREGLLLRGNVNEKNSHSPH